MKEMNLLFVCSGNTCRSPMAQAYVNFKYADHPTLRISARSAGLYASGDPINPNSAYALGEYQIPSLPPHDYLRHLSHTVNAADLIWADAVICMNDGIAMTLSLAAPEYKNRISSLPGGVGDPFGGSEEEYLSCLSEIIEKTDRIIEKLTVSRSESGIEYRFDDLSDADAEKISECERAHFSDAPSADALKKMLRSDFYAVAAFCDDELCGFGYIYVAAGEAELLRIAVNEEFRGRKIGSGILSRLHDIAVNKGCAEIFLEVRRSNEAAIRLYESAGYEMIGTRKDFYKSPREDALLCKRSLT